MFERFDAPARAALNAAWAEASRRGDGRLGTEHLLLGLIVEGTPTVRRAIGVDLATARGGLEELDRRALAAIGLDAEGAGETVPPDDAPAARGGRARFTASARQVLAAALAAASAAHTRQLRTDHLLLALVDGEPHDPAVVLLVTLGVDPATVRARLLDAA
jgi:ATP-dependent Clp protease ATP-binding subunit ClpA